MQRGGAGGGGLGGHPPRVPAPRMRGGSQLRLPAPLLLRRAPPGRHREAPGPGPDPCALRFSFSSSMAPAQPPPPSARPGRLPLRLHLLPRRFGRRLPPRLVPAPNLGPCPAAPPLFAPPRLASLPGSSASVPPGDSPPPSHAQDFHAPPHPPGLSFRLAPSLLSLVFS